MQISSNVRETGSMNKSSPIKTFFTEKLSKEEEKEIREQIKQNANAIAFNSASIQGSVAGKKEGFEKQYEDFQTFLKEIGYDGKPIAELSKAEAAELVSEDGFFWSN